ncbi:hypothetical protein PSPO01_09366 [Paraphaeosphaeria sporulosa]
MAATPIIWPTAPILDSDQVKHSIRRFFEISDSTEKDSGRFLLRNYSPRTRCSPRIPRVWPGSSCPLIVSRAHELKRVFCADSPKSDILVHGVFKLHLKHEQRVEFDFDARFVVGEMDGKAARLEFVQVWTDPTDMMGTWGKGKNGERYCRHGTCMLGNISACALIVLRMAVSIELDYVPINRSRESTHRNWRRALVKYQN